MTKYWELNLVVSSCMWAAALITFTLVFGDVLVWLIFDQPFVLDRELVLIHSGAVAWALVWANPKPESAHE